MNGNSPKTPKTKNRASRVFLVLYLLFGTLILAESAIPSGASGKQSNSFSAALAWVVNLFSPSVEGQQLEPSKIEQTGDSTLLSPDEEAYPQIALGTTSLLTYKVSYPQGGEFDFFDQSFRVKRLVGENSDYDLSPSQDTVNHKLYLRITGKAVSSIPYKVGITMGDSLTSEFAFKIVDLPRPEEGFYAASVGKSTLRVGEHEKLDVILANPKKTAATDGEHQSDWYLRRYYDPRKLFAPASAFTIDHPEVLSLDAEGFLYGKQAGTATLSYGTKSLTLTVEGALDGVTNGFALEASNAHVPCMNDYDFIADVDSKGAVKSYFSRNDREVYWTTLKASFGNRDASKAYDLGVHFASSDERIARIFPYAIDPVSQKASWFDEEGNPSCQVVAYRLPGNQESDVVVSATSLASMTSQSLTLHVSKALPTGLSLSGVPSSNLLSTNAQISITGNFLPANTGDKTLSGLSSDPSVVEVSGNETNTLFLLGKKEGKARITVTSAANPTLEKTFDLTVKNPQAINESNFSNFAGFMRKAAGHFTLFLVTALFGELFFLFLNPDPKADLLGLISGSAIGFAWAGFSEFIQYLGAVYFAGGRSGAWADVGIDTLGYVIGALLTWGIALLVRLLKKKRALKKAAPKEEKEQS
jgi:hypothetical protein